MGGPLATLRVVGAGGEQSGSANLRGTLQPDSCKRIAGGLCPEAVVSRYLSLDKTEAAVAFLSSLGWDTMGQACLGCLYLITNHLFRKRLDQETEALLEATLGTFHAPIQPMCHATELEFGEKVRALTRKFFHHLLRYQQFEKSFRLAIDLNDHDLFMDIFYYAKMNKDFKLAAAARSRADEISGRKCHHVKGNSDSDSIQCSHSSCSVCSSGTESSQESSSSSESDPGNAQASFTTSQPEAVSSGAEMMEKQVTFSDQVTCIKGSSKSVFTVENEENSGNLARISDPYSSSKSRNLPSFSVSPQRSLINQPSPSSRILDPAVLRPLLVKQSSESKGSTGRLESVPDFSEEEDSGAIKVVHFGVV